MKSNSQAMKPIELDLVGSSTFGRDPKISSRRTFNMIIADDWFTDYAGYKNVLNISRAGTGRGIFTSVRSNKMIVVVNNKVYAVTIYGSFLSDQKLYNSSFIGNIDSYSGDVFIDENNTNQIAICDQANIYIYNTSTGNFQKAVLPEGFIPGYVTYQDGRFITPDKVSASWALSQVGDGLNWFWGASGEPVLGAIQTKPDLGVATLRVPGRGNLLYVMGSTVTELWTDVGGATFPYQRNSSLNFDYGCINAATLASSDEVVAWLGINEKSGPVIMYTTGGDVQQISTDGINFKFEQLKNPANSSAFFVKLSGHLIYQLTFYDKDDNYTVAYDFTTKQFFDVTDENMNFHIARRVAFFNDDYYFVSFSDGNLYQFTPNLTTYDYGFFEDESEKVYEIPRIRVCGNIRPPNAFRFAINNVTFILEQGNDVTHTINNDPNYNPRIGLSISKNGGISFSSYVSRPIYTVGNRMNRLNWWNLGVANDLVLQFRFWGRGPWKATNGLVNIYQ